MAGGALKAAAAAETFSLALAWVRPAAALQAWFDQAAPGDRIEYARGLDLPREEAGVLLVQRWINHGAVVPLSTRDEANRACSIWLIERRGAAAPAAAQPDLGAIQMQTLLRALTTAAARGDACPSYGRLAIEATGQRSERAKRRVRWLMKRLEADGRIRVSPAPIGARHGPTVTILTGKHVGKTTRACSEPRAKSKGETA